VAGSRLPLGLYPSRYHFIAGHDEFPPTIPRLGFGRGGIHPLYTASQWSGRRCSAVVRLSAPRNHGNCASSRALASAAVSCATGCGGTGGGSKARRARWLRPWALPPRAPRRRRSSRVLLKRTLLWLVIGRHHIHSLFSGTQATPKCSLVPNFGDQKAMSQERAARRRRRAPPILSSPMAEAWTCWVLSHPASCR
jgi:hypothetical protein